MVQGLWQIQYIYMYLVLAQTSPSKKWEILGKCDNLCVGHIGVRNIPTE